MPLQITAHDRSCANYKLRISKRARWRVTRWRVIVQTAIVAAALFSSHAAFSQFLKPFTLPAPVKDSSTFLIFHDVTLGPYFTAGIARQNEDLPQGWNSMPRFSWAIGGTIDLAVNPAYGFVFSMLYDTRALYLSDSTKDNINFSLQYLSLQPSIRIYWLLLGVSFDFPMAGSTNVYLSNYTRPDQPKTTNYNENLNVNGNDLQALTELRATLSIPIIESGGDYLHLIISGSYPLQKPLSGTSFDTTGVTPFNPTGAAAGRFSGANAPGKGPLPAFEAGFTYQFDILH